MKKFDKIINRNRDKIPAREKDTRILKISRLNINRKIYRISGFLHNNNRPIIGNGKKQSKIVTHSLDKNPNGLYKKRNWVKSSNP